jgi:hypothetical protein
LADSWRGWDGERHFSSLEGELTIDAVHDGHLRLAICLREVDGPIWKAEISVTLDPGEDLTNAARDVRAVVNG